jgi:hypothetical protein
VELQHSVHAYWRNQQGDETAISLENLIKMRDQIDKLLGTLLKQHLLKGQ